MKMEEKDLERLDIIKLTSVIDQDKLQEIAKNYLE